MYKILRTLGTAGQVSVVNTDTRSSIILGPVSAHMISQLKDKGIDESLLDTSNNWDIAISKELATELAGSTLKMKKPMRDQRKIKDEPKENKEIDAMDVLLGLAKYKN